MYSTSPSVRTNNIAFVGGLGTAVHVRAHTYSPVDTVLYNHVFRGAGYTAAPPPERPILHTPDISHPISEPPSHLPRRPWTSSPRYDERQVRRARHRQESDIQRRSHRRPSDSPCRGDCSSRGRGLAPVQCPHPRSPPHRHHLLAQVHAHSHPPDPTLLDPKQVSMCIPVNCR